MYFSFMELEENKNLVDDYDDYYIGKYVLFFSMFCFSLIYQTHSIECQLHNIIYTHTHTNTHI